MNKTHNFYFITHKWGMKRHLLIKNVNEMKAEDLINKHLILEGGSDLAITDGRIYNAFLNAVNEAINYTHCCEELKDKEKISFDEWLRVEDIKMHQDGTFYISSERRYVELTFLINRYNSLNL